MSEEIIYVVTSGCYSDYAIEGCFKDRELAEKNAELCGGDVEEYCIEKDIWTVAKRRWESYILKDGKINVQCINYSEVVKNNSKSKIHYWGANPKPRYVGFVTSYVSAEHCHKLAVELWQKYLRRLTLKKND